MSNHIDLTGKKFGLLTAISYTSRTLHRKGHWLCKCDCGEYKEVLSYLLSKMVVTDCGCVFKNKTLNNGFSRSGKVCPEYRAWTNLRARCKGQGEKYLKNYQSMGISVCDRWANSFPNFLEDMGPRPSNKHSIERLDVKGNYEPSNCVWATIDVQNVNKGNTIKVLVDGILQPLRKICEIYGFSYGAIVSRRRRRKITLQKSFDGIVAELFKPPKKRWSVKALGTN